MSAASMGSAARPALVDQAAGLRRLLRARPAARIAVAAASPQAGHATLAAELALALAQAAPDVLLVDAGDEAHSAAAALGAQPIADILEALRGVRTLREVSVQHGRALRVVRAQLALALAQRNADPEAGVLAEAVGKLCTQAGITLLVAAPGTATGLVFADHLLLVTRDDPDSITRSYALLKRISGDLAGRRVYVVLNGVRSTSHAETIFGNLRDTASRFLDLSLECMGRFPDDVWVQRAAAAHRPVMELFPASPAAVALRHCAACLLDDAGGGGAAAGSAAVSHAATASH